jgi:hypothetical protein
MEPKFNRVALELPTADEITIDPLQQELAAKAKRLLGYGLLEEHLQGGAVTQTRERAELSTLTQTFNELDIQPFDTREVEHYQRKQKRTLDHKSFFALPLYAQIWVLIEKMFSPLEKCSQSVVNALCSVWLVGGIAGVVFLCIGWWLTAAILSPTAFSALCMIYLAVLDRHVSGLRLQKWEWTKLTFAECCQREVEIPPFALNTAICIKEKMPDADLFVEAAMSTDRVLGDPFLCIKYGGAKHYLEVWNEFQFERKTTRKV